MPTQKYGKHNIRKLIRLGKGSLAMTLPIELTSALKWKEKQKVIVARKGRSLVIKDWKK